MVDSYLEKEVFSLKKDAKLYVPFTIDASKWLSGYPIVFLNKVYTAQDFKCNNTKTIELKTNYKFDAEKIDKMANEISVCLGHAMGEYFNIKEDDDFWIDFYHRWLCVFIANVLFKLEQFDNLKSTFLEEQFITNSPQNWRELPRICFREWQSIFAFNTDNINYYIYLYLADKYYKFEFVLEDNFNALISEKGYKISTNNILGRLRRLNWQKIKNKIKTEYYLKFKERQTAIGVYSVPFFDNTLTKWSISSKGKIRGVNIKYKSHCANYDVNLRRVLRDKISVKRSRTKAILCDVMFSVMPVFFLEEFKSNYCMAKKYLQDHPNLKVIYTETGSIADTVEKISMLLLKKRGGIIVGEQHGGNYQVDKSIKRSEEFCVDDVFYFWGSGAKEMIIPGARATINYAPSYKLAAYDKKVKKFNDIVFIGTAIFPYQTYARYGFNEDVCEQYINNKLTFFHYLRSDLRRNIILREYYVDFGWDVMNKLKREFPILRDGSYVNNRTFANVNCSERNRSFYECLLNTSLLVIDHISTTWLEALYTDTPFILILTDGFCDINDCEMKYFERMREVGILYNDPKLGAECINNIADKVLEWWHEPKRYETVSLIRERWTTKVDDIDKWWYSELINIAGGINS